jgi:glutamyl-tRNA synthetase
MQPETPEPPRVRIAPSPTGGLHVGVVRTALFNWLFARRHGGAFVLRIEDTDEARSTEESLNAIIKGFQWIGLVWDEGPDVAGPYGPYIQSERLDIYEEHFEKLLADDAVYRCFCTPEELAERRKQQTAAGRPPMYDRRCRRLSAREAEELAAEGRPACLRFRMPEDGNTHFDDLVFGSMQFQNPTIDDFVIRKTSSWPTYNFACVVDDYLMKISHVIRAEQHLSNTPRQVQLLKALGYEPPIYAHVPHVLAPDRTKYSKRHGATDLSEFGQQGYLPEAMLNYLALLGWSTGDEQELMSADELIGRFDLGRVGKAGGIFDIEKLSWMNGQYIRQMPPADLAEQLMPALQAEGMLPETLTDEQRDYAERVAELMAERLRTLSDIVELGAYFFSDEITYDDKAKSKWLRKEATPETLERLADALETLDEFSVEAIEEVARGLAEEMGVSAAKVIHPARAAVSGMTFGPSLFHLLELVGQERVVSRLRKAAELSRAGAFAAEA